MSNNPHAQYQRIAIETASPTKMVVMLYDGAIRFIGKLLPAMESKNYYEQSVYTNKAQAIIAHLYATLDYEKGGTVATALAKIYVRMYDTLTVANIQDDHRRVKQVEFALRELRAAWAEVDRQMTAQATTEAPAEAKEFARAA